MESSIVLLALPMVGATGVGDNPAPVATPAARPVDWRGTLLAIWGQLRRERDRLGLTQAEVAEKAGISRRALQNYELGAAEPSLAAVCRWAAALGLRVTLQNVHDHAQKAEP